MPPTRFQGSKRKLAGWIVGQIAGLHFDTVLDAFGGTGAVAFEFKRLGKCVAYNDLLRFNHWIGTAIIENGTDRLTRADIDAVRTIDPSRTYDDLIARTFADIYFTDDENRWLDVAVQNISAMSNRRRQALACYALFQSALAKRPYNLFHRRNLYMRSANVTRTFGNKVTWDRPFDLHFRRFAEQANACVFDNGRPCRALNRDACDVPGSFDLVYIDPPYVNARGTGVDYHHFYHFLEGLVDYPRWAERIDYASRHRRLLPMESPWTSPSTIHAAFRRVFERFADSILVVSYRSDGVPTIDELQAMLKRCKRDVRVIEHARYQYVLSTNRRSHEVLLIGC
ncbi:MAG: DNA methyltransferase [Phycisphaerales bacterium]|nr:DNA methyltransferase [Phycisphaerales bacterium]